MKGSEDMGTWKEHIDKLKSQWIGKEVVCDHVFFISCVMNKHSAWCCFFQIFNSFSHNLFSFRRLCCVAYAVACCTLKIPSFTAHSIGSTSIASHILKYSETSIFLCPFRSCPMICGDTPIFSATNPCFIPFSFMHSFNVFPSIPFSPSFRNSTFR